MDVDRGEMCYLEEVTKAIAFDKITDYFSVNSPNT